MRIFLQKYNQKYLAIAENGRYAIYHRNHKDGCRNKNAADNRRCGRNVLSNHRRQECS